MTTPIKYYRAKSIIEIIAPEYTDESFAKWQMSHSLERVSQDVLYFLERFIQSQIHHVGQEQKYS